MRLKVYFGKVCAKHPELKGERYLSGQECAECSRARAHKRYEENHKAYLVRRRKYCEENREVESVRKRKYYEENREADLARRRKRYEENRGTSLAAMRKYREAFKAKHGIARATYYSRLKKQKEQQLWSAI